MNCLIFSSALCVCVCFSGSVVSSSATPQTVAYQASLSMGISRQEHWRGQPFPSPGDLSNLELEPGSPALQADSLPSEPPRKPKNQEGVSLWFQSEMGAGVELEKRPCLF